jgi:putative peptidoglycan lipid II flippase
VSLLYGAGYLATLWRERTVGTTFGATRELDAFYIALAVVTLLAAVPARAGTGPLIPCWKAAGAESPQRQRLLANTLGTVLCLVLLATAGLLLLGGQFLVPLVAPGLSPDDQATVLDYLRVLTPVVVCLGLYELWRGLLNARYDFVAALIMPLLNSIIITFGVVLLAPSWGIGSLIAGVIVGALLQALLPAIVWHTKHVQLAPALAVHLPDFTQLARLAAWCVPLVLLGQLGLVVDRALGSFLDAGGVTALNYASRLVEAMGAVITLSASTVAFPHLAQQIVDKHHDQFWSTCVRGSLILALMTIPLTLALVLFSDPIVRLVFSGGRFDLAASEKTSEALAVYALALLPVGVGTYLSTALHAMLRMRLLVGLAIFILVSKVAVAWVLLPLLALRGVAISQAVAYTLALPLVVLAVRRALRQHQQETDTAAIQAPSGGGFNV